MDSVNSEQSEQCPAPRLWESAQEAKTQQVKKMQSPIMPVDGSQVHWRLRKMTQKGLKSEFSG